MGNDGGTIAKRNDIVSLHSTSSPRKHANLRDIVTSLTLCGLLGTHLHNVPVVSDYKGRLYSKEKLLEALIARNTGKQEMPRPVAHVSRINDVVDVVLSWSGNNSVLVCPITGEERNVQLAYSRACGCVLSHKLLGKFSARGSGACPKCTTNYSLKTDIVLLNPADDAVVTETNLNTYRVIQEQSLYHNKKPMKRKRKSEAGPSSKRKRESKEKDCLTKSHKEAVPLVDTHPHNKLNADSTLGK